MILVLAFSLSLMTSSHGLLDALRAFVVTMDTEEAEAGLESSIAAVERTC